MTPVYLMAVCNSVWDCRTFHQLVEMLVLLVCVLIITVMRKLIGRLQGNSKNVHVSRPASTDRGKTGPSALATSSSLICLKYGLGYTREGMSIRNRPHESVAFFS